MRILFAVTAFFVICGVLFVAGCNRGGFEAQQGEPPPEQTAVEGVPPETPAPQAPPPVLSCQMGKPCDVDDATVTIQEAVRDDVLTVPLNHEYRGNWVVVLYTYTNEANRTVEPSREDSWRLEDSVGRTYTYEMQRTIDHAVGWNRNLGGINGASPHVPVKGVMIFEVAPDAEDLTLRITDLVSPRGDLPAEVPLDIP